MKYKLIVLDLDGTLTNSKKVITPRNREILIRVQEQGVRLVLASGRPTYGIVPLANELRMNEFGGFILSYNGGEIINWETQEMLYENVLPNDVVPVLYECARSHQLSILTYDGAEIVTENSQDPYVQKEAFLNKMAVRETNDFLKPYYEQVLSEQADGVIPNYGEQKTSGLHYSGAFENGQAAMCNMGSWFIATLQKYNAEAASNGVQPVNFGIVKYPHPDGAPAGSTLGTVTSLAVNANSEKKEAALDFVNWCASEDGAKCVAAVGTFPAVASDETNKIISSTDGFPSDDASQEALNTTAIYLEMPLSDKASEIETILNTEHDAIMTESETVDEGIANMNEQVQALLG